MSAATRGPRRVEFRIVGDVTQVADYLFGDVQYVVEPVTTTIVGEVADEQELVELCHRIRDAGIELVGLRRITADTADAADVADADDTDDTDDTDDAG